MTETAAAASQPFLPYTFFFKPWRGWGVARDPRGRTLMRFEARGHGSVRVNSAVTEQVLTFQDGSTRTVRWAIQPEGDARYFAQDLESGIEAVGQRVGDDLVWRFAAEAKGPFGPVRANTCVTYTMLCPTRAAAFAETRWMGLLLVSHATYYEQI